MATTPTPNPQPSGTPQAPPKQGSGLKIILWVLGIMAVFGFICVLIVGGLIWYGVHKAKQAGFDPELMKKNPVYASLKLAINASPDTEVISSDDDSGTLKVRDKKTGKVVIMKFDPESKSMVVTDENGKTTNMKFDPDKKTFVVSDEKGTTSMKFSGSSGTMEINGPDGTVKTGTDADAAPSWVPVYPGVKPQYGYSMNGKEGQSGNYTFTTQDSSDKVLGYYSDALKSAGLTKTSTTTTNTDGKTGGFVSANDESGKKSAVVTVSADNNGTQVTVTYSIKP